jgi:hypothetical protein
MQGFVPSQGMMTGTTSFQGLGNPWQGSIPLQGMSIRGNPSHISVEPRARFSSYTRGSTGGNLNQGFWNTMQGEIPTQGMSSNYLNSSTMQTSAQTPYTGQGNPGFYQNPGQQEKFSWQPGANQNPGSSFPLTPPQPRLPFLETLHFPDLSRLLNDPICHDPHWPPMPTKFPSDIPKFEGNPGEDPGDHVTTFHLWCSSNSLNDDSIKL